MKTLVMLDEQGGKHLISQSYATNQNLPKPTYQRHIKLGRTPLRWL